MVVMSTDWTSSSNFSMTSVMSSTPTFVHGDGSHQIGLGYIRIDRFGFVANRQQERTEEQAKKRQNRDIDGRVVINKTQKGKKRDKRAERRKSKEKSERGDKKSRQKAKKKRQRRK